MTKHLKLCILNIHHKRIKIICEINYRNFLSFPESASNLLLTEWSQKQMICYRSLGEPPAYATFNRKHLGMGTFLYRTGCVSVLSSWFWTAPTACAQKHTDGSRAADANCSWLHSPWNSAAGAGNRLAVCSPVFLFLQCPSTTHLDHILVKAEGLVVTNRVWPLWQLT